MDVGFLLLYSNGKKSPFLKNSLSKFNLQWKVFVREPENYGLDMQSVSAAAANSDAVLKVVSSVPLPQGV